MMYSGGSFRAVAVLISWGAPPPSKQPPVPEPERFRWAGQHTEGLVQILLQTGALFATPFSAHPCRVLAHSVRIFCAFYAFSELSAKCSGCTGLLTEPLGLAWLSTEMLHLLCILRAFRCSERHRVVLSAV